MSITLSNLRFESVGIAALKNMRMSYFYEIKLSQELFLEWEVQNGGQYYKIFVNEHEIIGYFILNKDNVLVEFYLIQDYIIKKEEIFSIILHEHVVKKVYCKTFDSLLLICSHVFARTSKVIATVFRDYVSGILMELEGAIRVRVAREADINKLLQYGDSGLYETPEELKYTVSNKTVYLFEKDNKLIGCGYLIRVLPDKNFYDIGVWVNPDFRCQGYGTMIVSHLKKFCFSHGYSPVCGCSVENTISRKVLEKNGFISKYGILEFEVSYHQFHV